MRSEVTPRNPVVDAYRKSRQMTNRKNVATDSKCVLNNDFVLCV